jgi:hypothetical protein
LVSLLSFINLGFGYSLPQDLLLECEKGCVSFSRTPIFKNYQTKRRLGHN